MMQIGFCRGGGSEQAGACAVVQALPSLLVRVPAPVQFCLDYGAP